MPCQLAPWEIAYEQEEQQKRKTTKAKEAGKGQPKNIRDRLIKLAEESVNQKAMRCTRELCASWRMLFEITESTDPIDAINRVKASKAYRLHKTYWVAHQIGDKANRRKP